MAEKIHDEALLRSRVLARAKAEYEARWGLLTYADEATLDVTGWRDAWERPGGGRDVEKEAQRRFAAVQAALVGALAFAQCAPGAHVPLGTATQELIDCAPALRTCLAVIDRKREEALTVNAAERPERSVWIRQRLAVVYYRDDEEALSEAPRRELAALALLGGWWPPKATGTAVRMRGLTVDRVIALEADLMARARTHLAKQRAAIEAHLAELAG